MVVVVVVVGFSCVCLLRAGFSSSRHGLGVAPPFTRLRAAIHSAELHAMINSDGIYINITVHGRNVMCTVDGRISCTGEDLHPCGIQDTLYSRGWGHSVALLARASLRRAGEGGMSDGHTLQQGRSESNLLNPRFLILRAGFKLFHISSGTVTLPLFYKSG